MGPDGQPRALSSRAFDVLLHLIENRHGVVGKNELMQAAWPRAVVEENSLNKAISDARRALGDSREAPRFILTVPGRGYQFVGEIGAGTTEVDDPTAVAGGATQPTSPVTPAGEALAPATDSAAETPAPRLSRRRLLAGAGTAALAVAAGAWWWTRPDARRPASLAVLPFKPLAGNAREEAVELGVAELLINRLSALPGLVVAPLSSVLRYSGPEQDPLAAARELDVESVLEGHVQILEGRIRLTARLLEAASGRSLWAGDFTERLDDFFAVQDSLARQLVAALAPNLPHDARERLYRHETEDVEAWQLYANGRYHVARRSEASIRQAIEYFRAAERRDPSFALAAAGLSEALAMLGVFDIEPPDAAMHQAREAAARALAADATVAEAHTAMGQVVTQFARDLETGRAHYQRALGLRPDLALAHAYMALSLTMSGRVLDAQAAIAQAQRLEPASIPYNSIGGFVAYFNRSYGEAGQRLASIVRAVPDAPLPRQFLARVLLIQGRGDDALALLEGRNEPAPGALSSLGRALAMSGRREGALAEVARLESLGARGFGVGFDLSLLHLALGDQAAALAALERAVGDRSQMGSYVEIEPALDPLRGDARFRAIAARMRHS